MRSRKTSFIVTIFNEEKTIERFLESLYKQTQLPDEIIIVDGGSRDKTLVKLQNYEEIAKSKKIEFKVFVKPGNRSVGRNEAINKATGDIILCSDSGNILDKNWIKNIVKPFKDKKVDVVAGYYKGKARTVFQKAVIPYALVMEDKVNPADFLPATRSVAFSKAIWKKAGRFNESYSHNEDYVFARKLRDVGSNIVFAKDAIVYWLPRKNLKQTFIMIWRFAFGDTEAGILRFNVVLLFARYLFGIYFLLLCALYKSTVGLLVAGSLLILYILWSVKKNYRYVHDKRAVYILPALQFTADAAVLSGTILGIAKRFRSINILSVFKKNKLLTVVLLVYASLLLITIQWGIPNENRPFPFHMDEWHQLQAVGNTFRYGTPNTEGSANGTMFHFLYTGLYLIPFAAMQYVDPFSLEITNSLMRERIFEVLRFQTIIFGMLSIILIYKIAELIGASKKFTILLFAFTPAWLAFSSIFKYDIALLFWILLSLLFMLKFYKRPTNQNYLFAAIPVGLAFAVKVSAVPLFLIYAVSFFWFNHEWKKNIAYFFLGITLSLFCTVVFGIPDTLFGRGNIIHFFYENVISGPVATNYFNLGMHPYMYLLTTHYPIIFGHGLMTLFIISCFYWLITFIRIGIGDSFARYKVVLFIYFSLLIFAVSLLPLQIYAGGNRSLVLLPFLVLLPALAFSNIKKNSLLKVGSIVLALLVIVVQTYESAAWMSIKFTKSLQEASSEWVEKNINKNEVIGLENIPIYQGVPDITLKEFYFDQYKIPNQNRYKYQIVDANSKILPPVIIVTTGETESEVLINSPKRKLLTRLNKEGYKRNANFKLDLTYINISDKDYYFSWMNASPLSIAVYKK